MEDNTFFLCTSTLERDVTKENAPLFFCEHIDRSLSHFPDENLLDKVRVETHGRSVAPVSLPKLSLTTHFRHHHIAVPTPAPAYNATFCTRVNNHVASRLRDTIIRQATFFTIFRARTYAYVAAQKKKKKTNKRHGLQ